MLEYILLPSIIKVVGTNISNPRISYTQVGESPRCVLAKVQRTFANWQRSEGCTGESSIDSVQLAKIQGVYWRKYSRLSPIDESHEGALAKVQWTFTIGECPVGESLIGEVRKPRIVRS